MKLEYIDQRHTQKKTERSALLPKSEDGNSTLAYLERSSATSTEALAIGWENPWIFAVPITLFLLVPTLAGAAVFAGRLTGQLWPCTIFATHWTLASITTWLQLSTAPRTSLRTPCDNSFQSSPTIRFTVQWMKTMSSFLDIFLCGFLYSKFAKGISQMHQDIDGTVVSEWIWDARLLGILRIGFLGVFLTRIIFGGISWLDYLCKHPNARTWLKSRPFTVPIDKGIQNYIEPLLDRGAKMSQSTIFPKRRKRLVPSLRWSSRILFAIGVIFLLCCLCSCLFHLTNWHFWWRDPQYNPHACCDDLDPTECAFPFPSFHHMIPDESTKTGWRVALEGNSLPPMRGGAPLDPGFLNELDGFSPMAPIIFYGLEGLKESNRAIRDGFKSKVYPRLVDLNVEESITEKSITLLWDVKNSKLVPHSAQVDELDPFQPSVLVVPAQPLDHATHYAIVVINATDMDGNIIPRTAGMNSLDSASCQRDSARLQRYTNILIPSLLIAAPWINIAGDLQLDETIQLMFDFVTASDDSLRDIERIRDATMEAIHSWDSHKVDILRIDNHDCRENSTRIARSIHGSIEVPLFLQSPSRTSFLSKNRLPLHGSHLPKGSAKFVVLVPCSLQAAALASNGNLTSMNDNIINPSQSPSQSSTNSWHRPKMLRAVVEYGHGLFYNRAEAYDGALARVANAEGYLIMAMDWRGMSSFDLPVVMKTMLAKPNLFQATRDNLYQGYANKIVLQHYAHSNMLEADWLKFPAENRAGDHNRRWWKRQKDSIGLLKKIPAVWDDNMTDSEGTVSTPIISVFLGASQGGILGAGYTTLLGTTGLIDRGVLSVPGTSFSLVMSRSADFATYDNLLLRNFYRNRQVRLMLSIFQLGWDPVEAAGMLAPPIENRRPLPRILLQSGLGDPVIPTMSTEALARAYNATILPNNPRKYIFGIPKSVAANASWDGPRVVLTEILYELEYQNQPLDNSFVPKNAANFVHQCLRQDCGLMAQLAEFINTGRTIDPCFPDGCLRHNVSCSMPWRHVNTRPKNWTCNIGILNTTSPFPSI